MERNPNREEEAVQVSSTELMDEVRAGIQRAAAGSMPDSEVAAIEACMRQAAELAERADPLLVERLAHDDHEGRVLRTRLRFSSHRGLTGGLLIAIKRRLVLPVVRFLYEYSQENFERQQKANRAMFACLQVVIQDNARLRRDVERLEAQTRSSASPESAGETPPS